MHALVVSTTWSLAAVDAAVAIYLLVWALRRQRRDKPLVAFVGAVLLVCAAVLAVIGWPTAHPVHQLPPVAPVGSLV